MEAKSTSRLILKPVPPFDFDLSVSIFSDGDPQYRAYRDGRLWEVLPINGRLALATITSAGNVQEPGLLVRLETRGSISPADKKTARNLITRIMNLDIDLKPFYRAVKGDPVMSKVARRLFGLKSPTTPTVFEALIDSIIEQQISLVAAHSMQRKLIHAFGETLELAGRTYYAFPTAEKLASVRHDDIRACGLSGNKSEYVKDCSILVASGRFDLDKFEAYDDIDEIREELRQVRGIGAWTAEMVMIRGLHKMDSIPADDVGLQAKIAHFYGRKKKVSAGELREVAESWGEWRGLGGYYLIMAHQLGLEPQIQKKAR